MWLLGHLAWRLGRRTDAAEHFSALPVGCYPDVDPLLACLWPELSAVPEWRSRSIERARASAASPWSAALLLVLDAGDDSGSPTADVVLSVMRTTRGIPRHHRAEGVTAHPRTTLAGRRGAPVTERSSSRTRSAAFSLCAPRLSPAGRRLDEVEPAAVRDLPLEVIDDLIDAGVRLPVDSLGRETDPRTVPISSGARIQPRSPTTSYRPSGWSAKGSDALCSMAIEESSSA